MDRLLLKTPRKTTYGKIREQNIRKTETKNAIKSTVGQAKESHLSGREIRFKIGYIYLIYNRQNKKKLGHIWYMW